MSGRFDDKTHEEAIARNCGFAEYAPELRKHLAEIIESPPFKGSHRAQELLNYVVKRALRGESEGLRERALGVDLFGRPPAYDTAEDAIVRVAASDVRKRLIKFYEGAGSDSGFRIDLPVGTYVPEFHCVSTPVQQQPADKQPVEESHVAVPPASPAGTRVPLRWLGAVILAALIALAAGWALGRRESNGKQQADGLISAAFEGASRSVDVIFGDEGLVQIQMLLGFNCTLEEYENRGYLSAPELTQQPGLRRLLPLLSKRQIVTIGDVQNAVRVRDNLRSHGWSVAVRHARLMNARDFRAGNFIILGSAFSNPWVSLFQAEDSNFPLEDPRPPGRVPAYVNRHPKPGEPPSFGVEFGASGGKTISHALVSLVDNVSHTGRVMIVAGQTLSATDMAGVFLLSHESESKVREVLKLPEKSPLENLEIVLRVTEVNEVGDSVELAACRRLPRRSN
jgi:hypothetical protein